MEVRSVLFGSVSKFNWTCSVAVAGIIVGLMSFQSFAAATIYPAPNNMNVTLSTDYTVTVDGNSVPVYRGTVFADRAASAGGNYSFTYFDFSGSVTVAVTSNVKALTNVVIRPDKGIAFTKSDNTMTFTLTNAPVQLSIEPDLKKAPLLLFANPPETNPITAGSTDVIYYGPGYTNAGLISLGNNKTLYIAGGAVVRGAITVNGSNVTIRGHGILDANGQNPGGAANLINMTNASNVTVKDIIAKDGWTWNCKLVNSNHLTFRNFKLISVRSLYNDCIDICNTSNVLLEDCFIRSGDDCISPKGMRNGTLPIDSIIGRRLVLWSDFANTWRFGVESTAPVMKNCWFSDIDVIHLVDIWHGEEHFGPKCIALQPANEMPMENINFTDIRIHVSKEPGFDWTVAPGGQGWAGFAPKSLIEVRPGANGYGNTSPGKYIKNCTFKNFNVYGEVTPSRMDIQVEGPDASHPVENITFENIVRFGQCVQQNSKDVVVTGSVSNIVFKPCTTPVAPRTTPKKESGFFIRKTSVDRYSAFLPDKGTNHIAIISINGKIMYEQEVVGNGVIEINRTMPEGVYTVQLTGCLNKRSALLTSIE